MLKLGPASGAGASGGRPQTERAAADIDGKALDQSPGHRPAAGVEQATYRLARHPHDPCGLCLAEALSVHKAHGLQCVDAQGDAPQLPRRNADRLEDGHRRQAGNAARPPRPASPRGRGREGAVIAGLVIIEHAPIISRGVQLEMERAAHVSGPSMSTVAHKARGRTGPAARPAPPPTRLDLLSNQSCEYCGVGSGSFGRAWWARARPELLSRYCVPRTASLPMT